MTDHLRDETWEKLAMGELSAGEREQALIHIVGCAGCATIQRGLRLLETEARAFDPGVPKARAAPPRPRRLAWALMAGGALAMAAAVLLFLWPRPDPDRTGGGGAGNGEVRGHGLAPIEAIGPRGPLNAAPAQFAWQPVTGADQYRVRLYTEDGTVLWTGPLVAAPPLPYPAEVRLAPGVYRWKVDALRGGSPTAASTLQRFEIR